MSTKIQTPLAQLKYLFIDGEGRNTAMPGEPERRMYVASLVMKKDSKEHKALEAAIDEEWAKYKTEAGLKPAVKPKTNGIKPVFNTDKETGEKTETDEVIATFKTNVAWPDGNPQVVKVFAGSGKDITEAVRAANWKIGNGSTGVIHGTAAGNNAGGNHKVTLYLAGIQLATLVKYEGNEIEAEDIGGDDIDLGDIAVGALGKDEQPNL